jgi:hypothetical protein
MVKKEIVLLIIALLVVSSISEASAGKGKFSTGDKGAGKNAKNLH